MLKCANNCPGWLSPPVWCHLTDERLLAAVRMHAVLSVNASQRSAFDSLPGGKHIFSGRQPDLLDFHQLAVIRIHPGVVGFPQPLTFFLSIFHPILFGGFTVFLFLTHRWQRNQGGKLLKNQTQSPFFGGTGSVATGHEFGGTDGYMVDHARGAGIAEEDHLGSWSVSPEFPERWGGFVQAVGATQPGVYGESKGIKHPPPLPPHTTNRRPRRRVSALQIRENRRGLLSGFSFCPLVHEAIFLCRSWKPGLLSAKTALYAYTDVHREGGVSTAYRSGLNKARAHRIGNYWSDWSEAITSSGRYYWRPGLLWCRCALICDLPHPSFFNSPLIHCWLYISM